MEKRTAYYPLEQVRILIAQGRVRFTYTALAGGATLGMDRLEMLEVITSLTMQDFFKSMTTHADHRIWQDVYRPICPAGPLYLKLTAVDDLLVVSFKEL